MLIVGRNRPVLAEPSLYLGLADGNFAFDVSRDDFTAGVCSQNPGCRGGEAICINAIRLSERKRCPIVLILLGVCDARPIRDTISHTGTLVNPLAGHIVLGVPVTDQVGVVPES